MKWMVRLIWWMKTIERHVQFPLFEPLLKLPLTSFTFIVTMLCYAMITFFLRKNEDTTHSHFTLYSLFLPNIIFHRLPLYTNMVLNCGCSYTTNHNITIKMRAYSTAIVVSMSLQRPLKLLSYVIIWRPQFRTMSNTIFYLNFLV